MNYRPTSEIIKKNALYKTGKDRSDAFLQAWQAVGCQALKLETRQEYIDSGGKSYRLFMDGDEQGGIAAIKEMRISDDELYESLRKRHIDFIRCRPIAFPVCRYLKWELNVYAHNAQQGERIFWCDAEAMKDFFTNVAQHDFMVFDAHIAFVHDCDAAELIQGGWTVTDQADIENLLSIYAFIKANSQAFATLDKKYYEPV